MTTAISLHRADAAFGLPGRALAMLRAIAAGRAEMICSVEPDLFFDGLACSDQITAHHLTHQGLICPVRPGLAGQKVPVRLTAAGCDVVSVPPEAA